MQLFHFCKAPLLDKHKFSGKLKIVCLEAAGAGGSQL